MSNVWEKQSGSDDVIVGALDYEASKRHFVPGKGPIWQDFLAIMILSALQMTMLPSLMGGYIVIDCITVWLLINFVRRAYSQSVALLLVASLVIELHSVAPAGMYFVVYWMILNIVTHLREPISWRHLATWLVAFGVGELFVILVETFTHAVIRGDVPSELGFYWQNLARLGLSAGFGVGICWLFADFEEEMKTAA